MHFVVVSLETGQSAPLVIPHLDPFVVDDNLPGRYQFLLLEAVTQNEADAKNVCFVFNLIRVICPIVIGSLFQ